MESFLKTANSILWGIPVLLMILTVGIYLTVRSGFAQFKLFPLSVKRLICSFQKRDKQKDGISGYKALCTALAATVGTGNIAGVAGAMAIGGPGVIFWMWICALFGMITKLAEVALAQRYRSLNAEGEYVGGPMYIIRNGLPKKYHLLAYIYAFFGVVAAFGIGNATQVNAVLDGFKGIADTLHLEFSIWNALLLGTVLAALMVVALSNGATSIGSWAERLVPFAAFIYIFLSIGALLRYAHRIPDAVISILTGAFNPKAVTCGVVGSAFATLRVGASRGVFTNEAGMGTASIAHASAKVEHPVDQGLMGIIEVFLDTIVICTLTALVILCSGVSIPYGTDPGIMLTMDAFSCVYGDWCRIFLLVLVCLFAFATILGWGLYGARCGQFLFGDRVWKVFTYAQAGAVFPGVMLNTSIVWILAEIVNGLMAIPNLIALFLLSADFLQSIEEYLHKKKAYSNK